VTTHKTTSHPAAVVAEQPWVVPASYAQERIWFASQLAGDVPVYHVVDRVPLRYPVAVDTVRGALAQVVARHETLRTAFRTDDGVLMQAVYPQVPVVVEEVDLRGLPDEVVRRQVNQIMDAMSAAPLPLDQVPLWRAKVVCHDEDEWALLFVAHHTVVDGASELNLHAELTEICAAAAAGRPAELPELPIQYADYAMWQRDRLRGAAMDELAAFWRKTLADLPTVHGVPADRPRPTERTFIGDDVTVPLPDQVNTLLPELARGASATPFMVMLAAYAALLHRLSDSDDIVVGVPVAGRDRTELQPLIGMFVNMLVLRIDVSSDPSFAELVERVRHTWLAAWDHQEMPYQKLVELLAAHRDPGVAPLYQLGFNYLTATTPGTILSETAEDDLMLEIFGRWCRIEYNVGLFDAATVRRIADTYVNVVSTVLAAPQTRMSELPVTTPTGLPRVEPVAASADRAYLAPRTAAEGLVAQVWAEVLGVEQVGAYDDFFDLGGHSLLALRVIARLSDAAQVDLSIQAFFADTTVAGVAAELERLLTAELDDLSEEEAAQLLAEEGAR
jgi:hypothetical protein